MFCGCHESNQSRGTFSNLDGMVDTTDARGDDAPDVNSDEDAQAAPVDARLRDGHAEKTDGSSNVDKGPEPNLDLAVVTDAGPRDSTVLTDSGLSQDASRIEDAATRSDGLIEPGPADMRMPDSGPLDPVCADETFDHDSDPETACLPCAERCGPGETETSACTGDANRTCSPCADETYDHDGDPSTPCVACAAACPDGQFELMTCTPVSNRTCQLCAPGTIIDERGECRPCPVGTFDDDGDPTTPCTACTVCPWNQITWGVCGPATDVECVDCGENPSDYGGAVFGEDGPHSMGCDEHDPSCQLTIDVVVFYTPAFLEMVGGDVAAVEDRAFYGMYLANRAADNSMLPPTMRYRLVGIERFDYEERDQLKSDLIFLRNLPHYQARRRALGADIGLFYLGTQGYGGYAYSNGGANANYRDRGIAVLDGFYQTDEYAQCGRAFETPAHELGHILAAQHMATQFQNPALDAFAYHNQEVNFRRNEAYGRPVSQHDTAFFTLMAYRAYKNRNNVRRGCIDCIQLPVYSSPDLWWFFRPSDDLYGYCLAVGELVDGRVELACQVDEPWLFVEDEYVLDPERLRSLDVDALLDRAVPLGVDEPSYLDPVDNETLIENPFSTRNRDQVLSFWPAKAANAEALAQVGDCPEDCGLQRRVSCGIRSNRCGACLPHHVEVDGVCLPSIIAAPANGLTDGVYARTGFVAQALAPVQTVGVGLLADAQLHVVELYLFTVDQAGEMDYSWANTPTVWGPNSAPSFQFEVEVRNEAGEFVAIGDETQDDAVIRDADGQRNHTLSYRFRLPQGLTATDVRVHLRSLDDVYGFDIAEIRAFGVVEGQRD